MRSRTSTNDNSREKYRRYSKILNGSGATFINFGIIKRIGMKSISLWGILYLSWNIMTILLIIGVKYIETSYSVDLTAEETR